MINELTGSKDCGHKLCAIYHRVESALKEPDKIFTGIALTAFRVFVIIVEFFLANITVSSLSAFASLAAECCNQTACDGADRAGPDRTHGDCRGAFIDPTDYSGDGD